MDDEIKETAEIETAETPAEDVKETPAKDPRSKFNIFAIIGIILTIAAWIILSTDGKVALAVSVVAFIMACIGLKSSTRLMRNTAICSIVASGVLIVVVSAFLVVIFMGLNSI